MPFLEAGGHRLEYVWAGSGGAPTLVFLHEGLGSVAMWKDFPEALARATGGRALVYSRWGYGRSDPVTAPRPVRYMHDEALEALPDLLTALEIRDPILVGHSDGGSIALIYAGAEHGAHRGPRPRALILEAPHVFVEDISVESIAAAGETFRTTDLKARLARYHDDPEGMFRGWNEIWLHPDFRRWNIESYLPRIACPVLAIQGEDDEYGTARQVEAVAAGVKGPVEVLMLPECGHSPHRDQRRRTLDAMADFIRKIGAGRASAA